MPRIRITDAVLVTVITKEEHTIMDSGLQELYTQEHLKDNVSAVVASHGERRDSL